MTAASSLPPEIKTAAGQKSRPRLMVAGCAATDIRTLTEIFDSDSEMDALGDIRQAPAICRSAPPDLILLDAAGPDPDGLEICRQLKAAPETKDIPVIVFINPNGREMETRSLDAGAADFIPKPIIPAVVRARVQTHLTLKKQRDLLASLARADDLTGAASRRRFEETLNAEWRRCRRLITPLALFMIDIDHFGKYNDGYGRAAGDACLKMTADILKGQIGRSHDLLARYEGGKFACALPDIYFDGAMQKAEAMVEAVRCMKLPHAFSETAPVVTVSMGVVVTIPGPDRAPVEAVTILMTELGTAKQKGGNQVSGKELPGYFSNTLK